MTSKPAYWDEPVAFVWEQFSVYHLDRLDAMAAAGARRVIGIEIASRSQTYAWAPTGGSNGWQRELLIPDAVVEEVPWQRKLKAIVSSVMRTRAKHVFFANNEQPEILAAVPLLRARGVKSYAMLDGKFDDSMRRVGKEVLKQAVFRLYSGAIVAGRRHEEYYRFLGLSADWMTMAYDTISVERIRAASGRALAPAGEPHATRDFVCVARFVPKKNLATAIKAFAVFRNTIPGSSRKLILCGSGPLEPDLRALAVELGVAPHIVFKGFLGPDEIAATLADALALILPSIEEQWGLVVNEAVALGIPVLCSENVGARDTLVRGGINGFVFEPRNSAGLAFYMGLLANDAKLWSAMASESVRLAPLGDCAAFVDGVERLLRR